MLEPIYVKDTPLVVPGSSVHRGAGIIVAALAAGTVLASAGIATADVKAKKSVTFGGSAVAEKTATIVINGTTVTYTTTSTTRATEVAGIAAAINGACSDVVATASSDKLSVEAVAAGYDGNALTIEFTAGESGLTAGDVTVEATGILAGDERFDAVDATSNTASEKAPSAILLEDAKAGETKAVGYDGDYFEDALKFRAGQSLVNFKKGLREIGIFTRVNLDA